MNSSSQNYQQWPGYWPQEGQQQQQQQPQQQQHQQPQIDPRDGLADGLAAVNFQPSPQYTHDVSHTMPGSNLGVNSFYTYGADPNRQYIQTVPLSLTNQYVPSPNQYIYPQQHLAYPQQQPANKGRGKTSEPYSKHRPRHSRNASSRDVNKDRTMPKRQNTKIQSIEPVDDTQPFYTPPPVQNTVSPDDTTFASGSPASPGKHKSHKSSTAKHRKEHREDITASFRPAAPQVQSLPAPAVQDPNSDSAAQSFLEDVDGYGTGSLSNFDPSADLTHDPYTFSPNEDGTGQQTPRPGSPRNDMVSTYGYEDASGAPDGGVLDERYAVVPSNRFVPGEVFKTVWSEPLGSSKNESMTEFEERSHLGQRFYMGIRRFIVVANDEGHCTCVPILTYERRGCTKKGVKPAKHGVIYHRGAKPRYVEGEPELGFSPVQMELDHPSEKLAPQSRVNYSKLVTVEHNVKVFFVGRVRRDHFDNIVQDAVDKCWSDKRRDHRHSRY